MTYLYRALGEGTDLRLCVSPHPKYLIRLLLSNHYLMGCRQLDEYSCVTLTLSVCTA